MDTKTLDTNPDMVKRFMRATLKGLADALANPQEAAAAMNKVHRQVDLDIIVGETKKVGELATFNGKPAGSVDTARLQKTIDFVASAYVMKNPVTVETLYAPGFLP